MHTCVIGDDTRLGGGGGGGLGGRQGLNIY